MSPDNDIRYEFNAGQSRIFSALSSAMTFVAVAMLAASVVAAGAMLLVARSTLAAVVMLVPLPVIIAIIAVQLSVAARRFRRIANTRGNDVENLMVALAYLTKAYRMQRWLWLVVSIAVIAALATTIVGR